MFEQEGGGADSKVSATSWGLGGMLVSPQQQGWAGGCSRDRGGSINVCSLRSRNKFPSLAKELK